MKNFITAIVAILFAFCLNTSAFAHSHIGETVPADGEVVTDSISELVLNFEASIEQGSYLELFGSNGNEIELAEIVVKDNQLIGTLAEPLANDEYKVEWSVISKDGYPLEGSYTFTMNAKVEEETNQSEKISDVIEDVESTEEQATSQESDDNEESSTIIWIIVAIVAILILAIVLFKRKR